MLTAYDFSMAKIVDEAGMDILLVGDSASNVMAGHETTLPITLDQMIYHASAVVRAVKRAFVVVDIPFGNYQGNSSEALRSAIRIMKESGAHAVKVEGGAEIKESVLRILSAGVPVMGHLGLTPQSIYKFGTYTVRAREEEEAEKLIEDAKREPLHAGLSMNCIQPAKPVGLMCRTFDRVGNLFCEACGCGFTSRGVPVEGGVEVRLGARKKHNLRHGPYYSLGGER